MLGYFKKVFSVYCVGSMFNQCHYYPPQVSLTLTLLRICNLDQQHFDLWKKCTFRAYLPWPCQAEGTKPLFREGKACQQRCCKQGFESHCVKCLWVACWHHCAQLFTGTPPTSRYLQQRWFLFPSQFDQQPASLPSLDACGHWQHCLLFGFHARSPSSGQDWMLCYC